MAEQRISILIDTKLLQKFKTIYPYKGAISHFVRWALQQIVDVTEELETEQKEVSKHEVRRLLRTTAFRDVARGIAVPGGRVSKGEDGTDNSFD